MDVTDVHRTMKVTADTVTTFTSSPNTVLLEVDRGQALNLVWLQDICTEKKETGSYL